jgi:glycosyltransferase involved in cell wall biosynthesis
MRIGIDARELCGRSTGVGRYLSGLLEEWTRKTSARGEEFVLYSPAAIAGLSAPHFTNRVVAGRGGTWWEQVSLPRAASDDRLEVFFSPAYSLPLGLNVPRVVAIHDVSFAAHPEWFRQREGMRRRWLARRSAAAARAVVTISEFSRTEIRERLGVADERIRVIPPGISAVGSHEEPPSSLNVLYVGSIFNRRHIPELIEAFGILAARHSGVTLTVVGENRTYPFQDLDHTAIRAGVQGRVRWRPYVSGEDLLSLYRSARVFAFLSEYEGLGLTPLEAIASGVPALLLDTPVARESCRNSALYVPRANPAEIADTLERLMFDEGLRAELTRAAPGTLARYQWSDAASETLAVLEEAARSRRP